jgi:hypothetical protein
MSEGRGEKVRNRGREEKRVLTCYGWFTIPRTILEIESGEEEGRGSGSRKRRETPLDEFLGIKALPYNATAAALEKGARWGQAMTYKDCEELFKEEFQIDVTDSYLQHITDYVGKKVLEEDRNRVERWKKVLKRGEGAAEMADLVPDKPTKKGVIYIMIDGSMINTRDSGEGESSWKEVKLVLFFAADDAKKKGKSETVRIRKKDYAVWLGGACEFYYYVLEAAVRNHCFDYEQIVVISDGATWIRQMCEELFPDAVQILDFWHMAENIYSFAHFLFHDDEAKYKPWADARIDCLREGNAWERAAVLADLKRYEKKKCPAGVCNAYTYLKNNQEKIHYADYTSKGWYIGSGPMESSNKTAVQRRMKQSGMRWGTEHARRLLALRIRRDAGRWNEVSDKLAKLAA